MNLVLIKVLLIASNPNGGTPAVIQEFPVYETMETGSPAWTSACDMSLKDGPWQGMRLSCVNVYEYQ